MKSVWIFNGDSGRFPGGAFSIREKAEEWIKVHSLSGVLTKYPMDCGVYDHAVAEGYFTPKKDYQNSPAFISAFTSASQEHYHYENGVLIE
ncbi:hypothetical protein SAMN02745181_3830 [Rubritalea squalenifaciens DSM 18772]|uniref:DUF7710 domain-containing protein n=1 Tax=Rubritalea squalenifaciens DSM 18772 TaxID=1123071 RepID=A0A1M6SI43_9BACT|nr:hypothetical protein [Rubritalea squalenifaciens]SHK44286.1 hypothetical protein SAMN02745181_3830 [Rubritalea squalenifaciens DSM 18772]